MDKVVYLLNWSLKWANFDVTLMTHYNWTTGKIITGMEEMKKIVA